MQPQPQPPLQPCPSPAPCAACKTLRRKCTKECIFAPYFPPDHSGMENFKAIHAVYGASNLSKLLKELEPSQRKAAVESLVYEAKCRVQDKTYGCVGIVAVLQAKLKRVTQATEILKRKLATYNQQSQPSNDQQLALLQKQNYGNFMQPMNLQQTMCPTGDTSITIWDPQQLQQLQQQQNLINMMPLDMQQMLIQDPQQSQQQQNMMLQQHNLGDIMPLNLQQMMHPRRNPGIVIREPQQLEQQHYLENVPLHLQQMMHPRGNPGILIQDPQEISKGKQLAVDTAEEQQHNLGNIMPLNLMQMMHPRGNPGIVIREPQQSEQQQYLENVPLHLQQMMHPMGIPGILSRDPQEISKGKQLAMDTAEEQEHNLGNIMPLNLMQMMHPRGNPGIVIREPQQSEQQQYLENVPLHLQQMMHPMGNPGIVSQDPQEISKGKQLAVDTEEEQQIMLEELHLQQALQENIRINRMQVASEPTLTLRGGGECETQPPQQAISMQEHLQCQPLQLQQQDPSLAQQDLITWQFWQKLATHSQQHTQRENADDLLQLFDQQESSQSQQCMQAEQIGPSQQGITFDLLDQFAQPQASQLSQQHIHAELSNQAHAPHSWQHEQRGFIECSKGILTEVDDDVFTASNLNQIPEAVESFMAPGSSYSQNRSHQTQTSNLNQIPEAVESFMTPGSSYSQSRSHQTQTSNSQQHAQNESIDRVRDILLDLGDEEGLRQWQAMLHGHNHPR